MDHVTFKIIPEPIKNTKTVFLLFNQRSAVSGFFWPTQQDGVLCAHYCLLCPQICRDLGVYVSRCDHAFINFGKDTRHTQADQHHTWRQCSSLIGTSGETGLGLGSPSTMPPCPTITYHVRYDSSTLGTPTSIS